MNPIRLLVAALALAAPLAAQAGPPKGPPQPADLVAQTTCPISGEELTGGEGEKEVVYEGQKIRLCCAKCVKKFDEFPDAVVYGMYRQGVKPENTQTACVVSGEELGDDYESFWVMNKELRVCCKKCLAKVAKDPAVYFDKLQGRKKQTHCPVMGGEIDPEVYSVVQGQKVYHCCPGCEDKMKTDPAKFFAAEAAKGVVFEPATNMCVVMEEPNEDKLWWVTYEGRRIHFCCRKCVGRFVKDPAKYLAMM